MFTLGESDVLMNKYLLFYCSRYLSHKIYFQTNISLDMSQESTMDIGQDLVHFKYFYILKN